jgi:hypothetical protein
VGCVDAQRGEDLGGGIGRAALEQRGQQVTRLDATAPSGRDEGE